ncbi:MAG: NAD(P)H-hydrate epimerase, partial [Sandarakinorhabdus sp.]
MFIIDSGQPLLTAAAMRAAEAEAIAAGTAALTLMERAAAGAARAILAYAPARRATILCGPGNNGGDG